MSDTVNSRQSSPTAAASNSRYDLFVFGDSLSDTGRFYQATLRTIPVSPPYADGRFSNGPLAVEYLAPELGLNLTSTTNFAIGGAQTGNTNFFDPQSPVPLGGLLTQVADFRNRATTLGADANDLYLVWAGGNDFLNLPANPTPQIIAAAVANAVSNITSAVNSLVQAGARNIVVAQTPNLGRVPQSLNAGLLQPLTNLSIAFNTALANSLNALEQTQSGTNVVLTDLFPLSESVAQSPATFDFTNITTGYVTSATNPTPTNPSADPNGYFFWDQVHPTTRAHQLFANVFEQSVIAGITADLQRVGTAAENRVVGFSGNDSVRGLGGNDLLEGNPGDDILDGGQGNDTLVGGTGNDTLLGRGGRDRLTGIDPTNPLLGRNERDELRGGIDRDLFVLGDQQGVFYNDGANNLRGLKDFGLIGDLQRGDRIQLSGDLQDYAIRRTPRSISSGIGIYLKTSQQQELIGVVSNTTDIAFVTRAIRTVEVPAPIPI
ncbi:SGNH/GDSL hydrolase family protein [Leptolyngbya ohadii]|uniref:SGNH/GDSL hydrolase family protein n=1 Tax=Leptolyngbya ohadii TaxID=1962290 RepID=UPI000B59B3F1|nr:SGNH/GDSL hydrolase family protein [Leptolyngbya ohadii]